MAWNWKQPGWPEFAYDSRILEIEPIGEEAAKTSEIEGELLDRDSVQSSLRQQRMN